MENERRTDRIVTGSFRTALTALTILLLALSLGTPQAFAETDVKTVDTMVGSYDYDGITVRFVSHMTDVRQWLIEPTGYVETVWGEWIPIDGELRIVSSTLEHDMVSWDGSRGLMTSLGSSYIGTLEIVPNPEIGAFPQFVSMPKDGVMRTHIVTKTYGELGAYKQNIVVRYVDSVPTTLLEKTLTTPVPLRGVPVPLTGLVKDRGVDEDGDSLYEYLTISVEVQVKTPGLYVVVVSGLSDSLGNWIDVSGSESAYLERGSSFIDVALEGGPIYSSRANPSAVSSIDLYDQDFSLLGSLVETPLSREYSFDEFAAPPA